jgi:hypothetical protein
MESITLGVPLTVKPGGTPAFRIKALRALLARMEREAQEIRDALKALGDAPRVRKPDGGPESPPPWVEGSGFLPRIFDAHPEVKALHDAFHALPVLSEGTPEYQEARKAYVAALYGTTVEARVRKMNGQFIRRLA